MGFTTILMFAVMLGLIFMMQRQQKKQAQARQEQLNTIEQGDEVLTIGGMYALVDEVNKETNRVVLDVDGVFLPFELSAIKRVVTKSGAVSETVAVEEVTVAEESETDSAVVEETSLQETEEVSAIESKD